MISQEAGTAAKLLKGLGLSTGLVEAHIDQALDKGQTIALVKEGKPRKALDERYKIESVIGIGSLSTVYRARDLRYSNFVRLVAVKEMQTADVDEVEQHNIIRAFRHEAGILATLKHPFIPRFYEFFSVADRFYIVMEYIVGQDLETILGDTEDYLSNRQVLNWGIQLCDVLSYLHNHPRGPIIFRDMKPSNIMIDRYGNVRLIDFNIARVLSGDKKRVSVGTQGYSPPEQYHGIVTPRVDIYALGATLHHLLSKQDPRMAPAFSFDQRPIRHYNPEVNIALEVVILRALSYHENQRYTSAEAMKQALISTGIK
jgi:serine/threonine protein kinase